MKNSLNIVKKESGLGGDVFKFSKVGNNIDWESYNLLFIASQYISTEVEIKIDMKAVDSDEAFSKDSIGASLGFCIECSPPAIFSNAGTLMPQSS